MTLSVLGNGMTQYQLDSNLTITTGAKFTMDAGTRLYRQQRRHVTVNGGLAIDNAAMGTELLRYNGSNGLVVNRRR